MQPTFTQVPPRVLSVSSQTEVRRSCAALIAATYPPGPPPMMTTSAFFTSAIGSGDQHGGRILDQLLDAYEEQNCLLAVHYAVVIGKRDVHHRPDLDFAGDRHRAVLRLVKPENPYLRVVDDRSRDQRSEDSAIRDRKCSAGQVVHVELSVARALGDSGDLAAYVENPFRMRVLDVGNDEACVGRDGNSHIHVMSEDDRVAIYLRVNDWKAFERHARGLHEERHECQLHAVLLLDLFLHSLAKCVHRCHIDFVERCEMSRGVL